MRQGRDMSTRENYTELLAYRSTDCLGKTHSDKVKRVNETERTTSTGSFLRKVTRPTHLRMKSISRMYVSYPAYIPLSSFALDQLNSGRTSFRQSNALYDTCASVFFEGPVCMVPVHLEGDIGHQSTMRSKTCVCLPLRNRNRHVPSFPR